MNKFNFKTARFIGIIVFICLIFALIVMKAYQYLPEENARATFKEAVSNDDIQYKRVEDAEETTTVEEQANEENYEENESEEIVEQNNKPVRELESIEELSKRYKKPAKNLSPIEDADRLKESGNYKEAIEQYKEAAMDSDAKSQAYCYEQIATIHAIEKHYGSALSFAQKAYNTYPSTQREILLARIYYKTGNIEKATNRVNNILKRDFDQDK